MRGLEALAVAVEGLDHPEGVTVAADGTMYAGGEAGQVYRIDLTGGPEAEANAAARSPRATQIASTDGFLLGLCADGNGRLYCCDVGRRELVRVDPATGSVAVHSTGPPDAPFVNPNWPVFGDDGALFVTDSGHWKGDDGSIVRIDPDGGAQTWCRSMTGFPNGACVTPAGDALLVLESTTPALVRVPIRSDGSAGDREVIAELPGTVPDGVTLDTDGNAYVCCYRPDRILRVAPSGDVEVLADDPEGTLLSAPTNGVWLPPDHRRLLVGNLGRWHLTLCDWGGDVVGVPLRYPVLPS